MAAVVLAASCLAVGTSVPSASAGFKGDGPTSSDFTSNGVFDQAGYIAALVAFESAPVLTIDGPITLQISDCQAGSVLSAVFVGYPGSQVSTVSTGSPTSLVITPPSNIQVGFNIIRETCFSPAPLAENARLRVQAAGDQTTTVDIIVDLRSSSTPGVRSSLASSVAAVASDAPVPGGGRSSTGGSLPTTGADSRSMLGAATAAILLGGSVVYGARRRFRVTPVR